MKGRWTSGDTFYLMSDALARWLLLRLELQSDPLLLIDDLIDAAGFATFVEGQRADLHEGVPMLKNDDVTMIRCRVA